MMAAPASLSRTILFPCPLEHSHGNTHIAYRSTSRTARGPVPFTTNKLRRCVTIVSKQYHNRGHRLLLRAQTEQATHPGSSTSTEETYRLTLNTVEARKSLRFREIYDGDGMRIVVDAVAIGSEAEQEGVRPGQRLLSVSDPIRTNEDWEVGPSTSLSRVRDAIQFRRPATISFQLTLASVEDDAGWKLEDAQQKRSDDEAKNGSADGIGGLDSELLANVTGQEEQTDRASSGAQTIADQLEEQQRSLEAEGAREQAKLKARVQKRRNYMERESGRNDGPFFALLLSFFVLPAAVILAIAFSSGYLDTIADSYRRF